jgi:hypothetical protein
MSQKSGTPKMSSEQIVKDIRERPANNIQPKRKSALCLMACAASTASRNSAGPTFTSAATNHPAGTRKDQTSHNPKSPLATPIERRIKSNIR